MQIDAWLQAATADLERRGLSEVTPFLTALAAATAVLRSAQLDVALADERAAHDGGAARADD